ncbi:hypothetical protein [Gymnodinialimonas hymeniacidonis]|uniref:hypothetical protein n=1 Tax=Gymnodinialimonas hymeniacidonis TaxID=3126508 RepID=UPI0034C63D95
MKIYWSANAVPELQGLDRKEQMKRFKEMNKQGRKQIGAMPWVYLVIVGIIVAIAAVLLGLTGAVMGAVVGGIIGFAVVILIQSPSIEHGRVWYREHYGASDE